LVNVMPLNPFFLQGSSSEQRLIQDIINEQLKIYGQDVVYLPRKIINKKSVLKEIVSSKFDDSYRLEAYLLNYDGFEGQGDILSKFGVKTTDSATFVISKERFEDFITPFLNAFDENIELITRPQEGDLIYLPLDNTMFEIKYVEGKKPFYQLNNLYVYQLSCEVMDYELDDNIDTSIEEVDKSVSDFGYIVKLEMVGSGSITASASVQLAKELSTLTSGKSVSKIDLINDGTGYLTTPIVSISTAPSSGINASAVAIMTSRSGQTGSSIERILITNPGYGYTIPPLVVIKSSTGSGAIATAIVSEGSLGQPSIIDGGNEYSVSPVVSISSAPSGGTNAEIISIINSSGIVTSLRYINAGSGYTVAPSITFESPTSSGLTTDNYKFKEVVRGVSTGTTAVVNDWDSSDRILKVTVLGGYFTVGEAVVGIGTTLGGSDSKYIIKSISTFDEYDTYAENISIETEADQILDFSESNPFGEF